MVRDLAIAGDVLQAGRGIGEGGRQQVLRLHSLNLGRHLAAVPEPRHREGEVGVPAPSGREHRRIQQRLHQDFPGGRCLKEPEDALERK